MPELAVTVSVYVPTGVPGELDCALEPPPPHETQRPIPTTSMPNKASLFRRNADSEKVAGSTSNEINRAAIGELGAYRTVAVGAVVVTLIVTGTELVPSIVAAPGEAEHTDRDGAPLHTIVTT